MQLQLTESRWRPQTPFMKLHSIPKTARKWMKVVGWSLKLTDEYIKYQLVACLLNRFNSFSKKHATYIESVQFGLNFMG